MDRLRYELFDLEHDLTAIANQGRGDQDWMVAANAESAAGLASKVHEARVALQPGVITRFHAGEVRGHSAPAHLILRTSYEFNDAVVAVASSLNRSGVRRVDDSQREKYGLLLRPIMAGSIQVDLVCPGTSDDVLRPGGPELPGQTVHEAFSQVRTATEEALERVLDALEAVHSASTYSAIEKRVANFPPTAWGKLVKMASRVASGDFTVDFRDRQEATVEEPKRFFSFTPANAVFLKSYVESRGLERDYNEYEGTWMTVSNVRNVFDLVEEDESRTISGSIPEDLVAEAAQYFEKRVRIVVTESVADELNPKRKLVSIEELTEVRRAH